jgi:hypothetical protein
VMRAAARALDADRAHGILRESSGLVERWHWHRSRMPDDASHVGDGKWGKCFEPQMTLPKTVNWPPKTGSDAKPRTIHMWITTS